MNEHESLQTTEPEKPEQPGGGYQPPTLTVYGSLLELTLGTTPNPDPEALVPWGGTAGDTSAP